MKRYSYRWTVAATLVACGALASAPLMAQTQDGGSTGTLQQLQQQVRELQQKVQELETAKSAMPTSTDPAPVSVPAASPPKNKTYLGGAFYLNYGRYTDQGNAGSGDGGFSYASLNANGNYGAMKWGFDERIGPSGQIADKALLHLAWISYDFNQENTVTGGFFQVPYGNYPYGYKAYWGSMGYYTGFNDNQAFGLGYTLNKNNWRWDLDVFKNGSSCKRVDKSG